MKLTFFGKDEAPDQTPRLPGCSQVVAGQCLSSPHQGWVGDPGWAPVSLAEVPGAKDVSLSSDLESLLWAPTLFNSVFVILHVSKVL